MWCGNRGNPILHTPCSRPLPALDSDLGTIDSPHQTLLLGPFLLLPCPSSCCSAQGRTGGLAARYGCVFVCLRWPRGVSPVASSVSVCLGVSWGLPGASGLQPWGALGELLNLSVPVSSSAKWAEQWYLFPREDVETELITPRQERRAMPGTPAALNYTDSIIRV